MSSENPLVSIIKTCRDHGDLMESSHTTKNKDQARRLKWYLHPLLCPFFRIPHVRTKEPIYTTLEELGSIYNKGHRPRSESVIGDENGGEAQLGLPGF